MTSRPDPAEAEADRASSPDPVLRHHAAFCRLALPLEPGAEPWRREAGGAVVRIVPGAAGDTLPDGAGLRLLLAFLCDSALRAGSPTVTLGADAAALAGRMGLSANAARPLAEQIERVLAARISVAVDDGPELSVLDARSRPRGGAWPVQVKLNARFLASLEGNAVALDRGILRDLSGSPEAMDAHAWTRDALARAGDAATITAPWPELTARFGAPDAEPAAFREGFENALRLVFEADLSIELAVDDEGVSVRRATPPAEPAPAPAPTPAPEPTPVAPPVAAEVAPPPAAPQPAPPRAEPPRPREPRPQEDRPREARPQDERPRDDRPRDDRLRDDRPRDDRPREDRRPRREDVAEGPTDAIVDDMIRLRSHLTGLPQVVWLRRGHGDENILVAVTPGTRLDTDRITLLMVEPIIMQVSGGLGQGDFERVSAWVMANRDLIDDFWEGGIASAEEVNRRVRKAPGPTWR